MLIHPKWLNTNFKFGTHAASVSPRPLKNVFQKGVGHGHETLKCFGVNANSSNNAKATNFKASSQRQLSDCPALYESKSALPAGNFNSCIAPQNADTVGPLRGRRCRRQFARSVCSTVPYCRVLRVLVQQFIHFGYGVIKRQLWHKSLQFAIDKRDYLNIES